MPAADPVVIASYARTPMGGFLGDLAGAKADVERGADRAHGDAAGLDAAFQIIILATDAHAALAALRDRLAPASAPR